MTNTQESLLALDFTKVKKITLDCAFVGGNKTYKMQAPKDGTLEIYSETGEIVAKKADETVVDQLDTNAVVSFNVDYKKA